MENINWLPLSTQNYVFNKGFDQDRFMIPPAYIEPIKEIKTRKRKNTVLNVENSFQDLFHLIENGSLQIILGRIKQRSALETPKSRSSNYVGVSKNGDNWQVLINCGKFKKYIGTFANEKEAAISYDFYAICLHLSKAKTNFTYDSQLILEMIQSYNRKSKVFDPSQIISKV